MKKKILPLFFLLLCTAVAGFAIFKSMEQRERTTAIGKEIEKLEQEVARYEQKNNTLIDRINLFRSDEYKEREVKERLNYKKQGEEMIIVKSIKQEPKEVPPTQDNDHHIEQKNYQKWFALFFE